MEKKQLKKSLLSRLKSYLFIIAAILLVLLLVRWKALEGYLIPTHSMEPTFHGDKTGGDRVLVNKLSPLFTTPKRWEIWAFEKTDEEDPDKKKLYIKRVVGIGGERIAIRNGDVFINDKIARKDLSVFRSLMVPVFRGDVGEKSFDAFWELEGEEFEANGKSLVLGEGKLVITSKEEISCNIAGVKNENPTVYPGDLMLSFLLMPPPGEWEAVVFLQEKGLVYAFKLSSNKISLERGGEPLCTFSHSSLHAGKKSHIELFNVDMSLQCWIDGTSLARFNIEVERPARGFGRENCIEVDLSGEGLVAESFHVYRDLHYTEEGRADVIRGYPIDENQYFFLGDNSGESEDCRKWGAIPGKSLMGKPVMIFWPLGRLRFF